MQTLKLSPRLAAIAELVPEHARLCDVGTDHGYLPAYLLQRGKIESAVASDISPGPLEHARRTARTAGVEGKIRFLLADGLSGLRPDETDCAVVAGMGGETIAEILTRSVDIIKNMVDIIVQPMTKPEKLRAALGPLGLVIQTERLVLDKGRIYPVMVCQRGGARTLTDAELRVGPWELISGDPLFPKYLDTQIARLRKARGNLDELLETQRRLQDADRK